MHVFWGGVQPKLRSGWSTECTPKSSMLSNALALATIKSHVTLTSWWTSKPYAILLSFTSWGHGDPIPAVHHHYHHYHWLSLIFCSSRGSLLNLHLTLLAGDTTERDCFECPTQSFLGGTNPGQNYALSKAFQYKILRGHAATPTSAAIKTGWIKSMANPKSVIRWDFQCFNF